MSGGDSLKFVLLSYWVLDVVELRSLLRSTAPRVAPATTPTAAPFLAPSLPPAIPPTTAPRMPPRAAPRAIASGVNIARARTATPRNHNFFIVRSPFPPSFPSRFELGNDSQLTTA